LELPEVGLAPNLVDELIVFPKVVICDHPPSHGLNAKMGCLEGLDRVILYIVLLRLGQESEWKLNISGSEEWTDRHMEVEDGDVNSVKFVCHRNIPVCCGSELVTS
jgi:hypothetical protein